MVYLANSNLFGQRFQGSDGQPLWTGSVTYPEVVAIDLSGTVAENPSITTDGFNGVLVGYTTGDILFQRVTSAGTSSSRMGTRNTDASRRSMMTARPIAIPGETP